MDGSKTSKAFIYLAILVIGISVFVFIAAMYLYRGYIAHYVSCGYTNPVLDLGTVYYYTSDWPRYFESIVEDQPTYFCSENQAEAAGLVKEK